MSIAKFNSLGYKVEFKHKKAKIYGGSSELIGTEDQTRGNLFSLYLCDDTCFW